MKIEDPNSGGDVGRSVPPYAEGEDSLFFETFNRGKKSISLDLGSPSGRRIFNALVKVSDAVYSNLRGDVPQKIGIAYEDLKGFNPRIVCCSLSGFGMTGPRRAEPGYDYVIQGLTSAHPSVVPFQAFHASDGWLVIAAPKEKFWRRLTQVLGRPDLAEDPTFRTLSDRQRNSKEILAVLDGIIATKTVADWMEPLRAAGVPSGEVKSVAAAMQDPQTVARNMVVEAEHPRYGTVKMIASPVKVGPRMVTPLRAPRRGEHTDAVVRTLLDYGDADISAALAAGAFGAEKIGGVL